jgi:hypothetical protein
MVEQLAAETDAARQSELFKQYLRVCGLFHVGRFIRRMGEKAGQTKPARRAGPRQEDKVSVIQSRQNQPRLALRITGKYPLTYGWRCLSGAG